MAIVRVGSGCARGGVGAHHRPGAGSRRELQRGYFALRGADSRVSGDVLNANRCIDASVVCEPLLFEVDDFNYATLGAEWLIGFGDLFEAGAGIGYHQHTRAEHLPEPDQRGRERDRAGPQAPHGPDHRQHPVRADGAARRRPTLLRHRRLVHQLEYSETWLVRRHERRHDLQCHLCRRRQRSGSGRARRGSRHGGRQLPHRWECATSGQTPSCRSRSASWATASISVGSLTRRCSRFASEVRHAGSRPHRP